jgi:muramoyltetrapeptide carboxypeptidase LdcA involved in peptidoglycan recycling
MTWIQCSHWLLFNKTNIITVHKSKVIAIADDLHENIISNYERFLKEGYTEMSSQNEDIAEQRKRTKQMVEALGVGDANTTYH